MGSYYGSIIGSLPDPRKFAFRASVQTLEWARMSYCERPGVTQAELYFSYSTGSDSNPGTQASPKQTIAAINSSQDAYTDIFLKCGDEWDTNTTILIDSPFCRVMPYGSGLKPFINWFSQKITSGWALVTGTTYSISMASSPAWVRVTGRGGNSSPMSMLSQGGSAGNNLFAIAQAVSLADLEAATIPTWFWASGLLYINFQTATIPAVEWVPSTSSPGIQLGATGWTPGSDGIFLSGVRVDGGGMVSPSVQNEMYCIESYAVGTDVHCIFNCDAFYSETHVLGHFNNSTSYIGGIVGWFSCNGGWQPASGGDTTFIHYALLGGQEGYAVDCAALFGAINSATVTSFWQQNGWDNSSSFYFHTQNSTTYIGLLIFDRCRTGMKGQSFNAYPVSASSGVLNPTSPDATNIYIIDYSHDPVPTSYLPPNAGNGQYSFGISHAVLSHTPQPGMAWCAINCTVHDRYNSAGSQNNYTLGGTCDMTTWNINCDYEIDVLGANVLSWGSYLGQPGNVRLWNTSYMWRGQTLGGVGIHATGTSQSIINSLIQTELFNSSQAQESWSLGFPTGGVYSGNAIYFATLLSSATSTVLLASKLKPKSVPTSGDPRYQSGVAYPDGVALEYDIDWNPRNLVTPNIGPREVNPGLSVTQQQTVKFGYETGRTLTFRSYTTGSSPTLVQTISLTESPTGSGIYATTTALTLGTPITYTITDSVSGVVGQGVM